MSTVNPFDLLGDDDNDDPSQLIAAHQQKVAAAAAKKPAAAPATQAPAKLPSKPLPPAQAVREARSSVAPARGGGRGGLGRGRGGRGGGYGANGNADGFSAGAGGRGGGEEGDAGRAGDRERGSYGGYRGGRRGGYGGGYGSGSGEEGGDAERPPRRVFERRSGTGRGNEFKREGAGRGNWGATDDVIAQEAQKTLITEETTFASEKPADQEKAPAAEPNKDNNEAGTENKEKDEEEDKEMTLEEYEKIKEEKRKALPALKTEERRVDVDKEFESMKQLSIKKAKDPVFIKLGSDKDARKKDAGDRDEKSKKSVSINEFLKPAEGERFYAPGGRGRGRGRGRGDRGSFRSEYGRGGDFAATPEAIRIADPGQFPSLGGK